MDFIITSGWMKKWGSREMEQSELNVLEKSCSGSGYQSSLPSLERNGSLKLRWFILQSDFLSYFDRQPKDVNDMSCMKGQIYLRGCKLKHGGIITPIYQHWSIGMAPQNNKSWKSIVNGETEIDAISLVTPNAVEYTFTSIAVNTTDALKDLENWAYSISYAIHLADKPPHNNKIANLKGIIDLTHLSEISDKMLTQIRGRSVTVIGEGGISTTTTTNGSGATTTTSISPGECFGMGNNGDSGSLGQSVESVTGPIEEVTTVIGISLLINNEREFVLLFDSQEDRIKWVTAITNAVERTFTQQNVTIYTSKVISQPDKQVILSGWMRKTKANKWWDRRYCTLTPTSLIYYKEDPPQKPLGSIFLLVSSCRVIKQKSLDGLDWCFSLADSRGLEYFFNTETQDQMERWIKQLKLARKRMIITLLDQGGKIVIPISIGKDCGLVTIQVKETIRVNSLSNKIAYEIPVANTKTVTVVGDNKLEIIYAPVDGEVAEKRLEIISSNPHGILQLFKDLFSSQENTIN
ncbi:hypothetical protein PPL_08018 [Heterostelium album PN500]|uniref:PH domain-containing protein n=1 Tax=Heterostelium pallidum (strain ATCC 26659 / Pp 5 / PN500) TaxID=670386 RepID=D3BHL5_HETP5|nr:hypothetical protein PPL_08018 [Heterostelium album PN500]EFA79192.1 hypothetical protein PPL_08018 [Heterostelium album PN500]|eukprot:XP_020431313.1 hypothetical protein PPL_08018 [Heterostelium album PN500]